MYGYRAEQRKISKLMGMDYLWFGLFGQVVGAVLIVCAIGASANQPAIAGELVLILSSGVLIGGCAKFARFHGMNRGWAVLGLFNAVGILILMLMPLQKRDRKRGSGFSVIFAEPYRRDVWRMDVKVRLDERLGTGVREPIMLQLPRGARVGTAMKTLADVIPGLYDGDMPGVGYIVNGQAVDRRAEVGEGDEMIVSVFEKNT